VPGARSWSSDPTRGIGSFSAGHEGLSESPYSSLGRSATLQRSRDADADDPEGFAAGTLRYLSARLDRTA